ncbi:hypothetical protein LEMLEM_LOCUS24622, partial [Lemmus lemmus]
MTLNFCSSFLQFLCAQVAGVRFHAWFIWNFIHSRPSLYRVNYLPRPLSA